MTNHEAKTMIEAATGLNAHYENDGFSVLVLGDNADAIEPTKAALMKAGIPFTAKRHRKFRGQQFFIPTVNRGDAFRAVLEWA